MTLVRSTRLALVFALVAVACRATPAPSSPKAVVHTAARHVHRGPLTDYVPAAGLRWLVLVRPERLFEHPELRAAIFALASSERFDGFALASGVDLRRVPVGAVAGFDFATFYLAELPANSAQAVRQRFEERLIAGAIVKHPGPTLTRITGVVGETPESLLTIEDALAAVSVGDPTPVRIAEAFALGRLRSSPAALHGAALSALPQSLIEAPAVLLAPGPFASEWERAAGGLLAAAVAVCIAVRPADAGYLNAQVVIAGDFGDPTATGKRIEAAWASLANSSTGKLLGLSGSERAVAVDVTPALLTLSVVVGIDPLVRGLRGAVLGDISAILELPRAPVDRIRALPKKFSNDSTCMHGRMVGVTRTLGYTPNWLKFRRSKAKRAVASD